MDCRVHHVNVLPLGFCTLPGFSRHCSVPFFVRSAPLRSSFNLFCSRRNVLRLVRVRVWQSFFSFPLRCARALRPLNSTARYDDERRIDVALVALVGADARLQPSHDSNHWRNFLAKRGSRLAANIRRIQYGMRPRGSLGLYCSTDV